MRKSAVISQTADTILFKLFSLSVEHFTAQTDPKKCGASARQNL